MSKCTKIIHRKVGKKERGGEGRIVDVGAYDFLSPDFVVIEKPVQLRKRYQYCTQQLTRTIKHYTYHSINNELQRWTLNCQTMSATHISLSCTYCSKSDKYFLFICRNTHRFRLVHILLHFLHRFDRKMANELWCDVCLARKHASVTKLFTQWPTSAIYCSSTDMTAPVSLLAASQTSRGLNK